MIFYHFIVNFWETAISLLKILLRSNFLCKLPKIEQYEEMVILGNGPSLQETLKNDVFLKEKALMCVNAFALSQDFQIVKPSYYLFVDPQFWQTKINETTKKYIDSIYESIIQKTNWELIILLPFDAKHIAHRFHQENNPFIKVHFFNKTSVNGFSFIRNLLYKWQWGMPVPQNVLIACIMNSISMGMKTIYLTGADHSWLESLHIGENNLLYIKHEHFTLLNKNYESLQIIKNIFTGQPIKLHEQLATLSMTFKNYHIIKKYATYRKVKIYNISNRSYIDAFERVKI